jgi:hypothetical protein
VSNGSPIFNIQGSLSAVTGTLYSSLRVPQILRIDFVVQLTIDPDF